MLSSSLERQENIGFEFGIDCMVHDLGGFGLVEFQLCCACTDMI